MLVLFPLFSIIFDTESLRVLFSAQAPYGMKERGYEKRQESDLEESPGQIGWMKRHSI